MYMYLTFDVISVRYNESTNVIDDVTLALGSPLPITYSGAGYDWTTLYLHDDLGQIEGMIGILML